VTREEAEERRGPLEDAPFAFRTSADGKVFISWYGKQVMTLKGTKASAFLRRIEGLGGPARQIAMAKVTGNFKRGNERT
jgi:hypothetical protein